MIRVVVDTNVFVSGQAKRGTPPVRVMTLLREMIVEPVVSHQMLAEFQKALGYQRVQRMIELDALELGAQINAYLHAVRLVWVTEIIPVIADDPDDDIVLATALAGEVDYIISGDKHLLKKGEYEGIPIISPATFLAILEDRL